MQDVYFLLILSTGLERTSLPSAGQRIHWSPKSIRADAFSSVLFLIFQLEEILTVQYNLDSFDISIVKRLFLQHWYLKDLHSVPNFVLDNGKDCINVGKNVWTTSLPSMWYFNIKTSGHPGLKTQTCFATIALPLYLQETFQCQAKFLKISSKI